jgi:hypothetical protein
MRTLAMEAGGDAPSVPPPTSATAMPSASAVPSEAAADSSVLVDAADSGNLDGSVDGSVDAPTLDAR